MKTCSKCRVEQDQSLFGFDKRASDGLQSQCRKCMKDWKRLNAEKLREAERQYYQRNAELIRNKKLDNYHKDVAKHQAKNRAWKEANVVRVQEVSANWRKKNSDYLAVARQEYYKKNRGKYLAHAVARRAAKERATPPWFDEDMQWMVEEIYHLAFKRKQALGGDWHVDHIVPLRGREVCGLHVPWNLRVIPAKANLQKKNKFIDGQF